MSMDSHTGRARSAFRRTWSFLWTGPLAGVLLYVSLFAWCLLRYEGAEIMGVRTSDAGDRVSALFGSDLLRLQIRLLGLYALVGLLVGLLASFHVRLVAALGRRPTPAGLAFAWRSSAVVFAVHAWFLCRTMVDTPAVLSDQFFAKGGFFAWVQKTLTDWVPLALLDAAAWTYAVMLAGMAAVVAWRSWRGPARELVRRSRWLYPTVAALGAACAVLLVLALRAPRDPPRTKNNLLVIAVDSLRPDRIGHEARRPLPRMSELAGEAVSFSSAWSVVPRTFPSWVTMLTGQYPHEHGVRHMFPSPRNLAKPRQTAVSVLRDRGYRTAVISDFAGDVFARIDLGFDDVWTPRFTTWSLVELGSIKLHYHLLPYVLTVLGGQDRFPILKLWERLADPDYLTSQAIRWIRGGDGRPFALVVFYSTAHIPFAPGHPFYNMYTDPDYTGPSRYKATIGEDQSDEETRQVTALYDGALRATDRAIGRLLDDLGVTGLLDQTLVVLTADHGENIYENGFGLGHGDHLRGSESLQIPLVIRPPGGPPPKRVVKNQVRSTDIGPTVLDFLHAGALPHASGTSLRPLAMGQERAVDPPVFFETGLWFTPPKAPALQGRTMVYAPAGDKAYEADPDTQEVFFSPRYDDAFLVAKHRAVLQDGYKLIYVPTRRAGVLWELYDVRNDPTERHDLSRERPDVLDRLRRQLVGWMLSDPQAIQQGEYIVPRLDH